MCCKPRVRFHVGGLELGCIFCGQKCDDHLAEPQEQELFWSPFDLLLGAIVLPFPRVFGETLPVLAECYESDGFWEPNGEARVKNPPLESRELRVAHYEWRVQSYEAKIES